MSKRHEQRQYEGDDSLENAADWLRATVVAGSQAQCPCCGRMAGYEVTLSRPHVHELLRLFAVADMRSRKNEQRIVDQLIHVPETLGIYAESYSQNCIAACRYFGLVARRGVRGEWRLTTLGRDFIALGEAAPHRAWIFREETISTEGTITIDDLMSPNAREAVITNEQKAQERAARAASE